MASGEEQKSANTIHFKHFDIESDESSLLDHHFVSAMTHDCFKNPTSSTSKAIAKEWKILENNLPESIFVRAYEQRVDLLRAVIIGASGTPYHDGLFFFDILFPPNYPSVPPKVYYHSHGHDLNPNLYPSGYVCLSLIHTWHGDGVELWDPTKSTILQVLVSIQGLVLNNRPFFNEPGRESLSSTSLWERISFDYNTKVFIMSCKTLLDLLRKPPNGFQELVFEHCRKSGEYLFAAIESYSNGGSMIGEYSPDGASSSTSAGKVSAEYASPLTQIHMDMVDAFIKYQIFPLEIIEQENMENAEPSKGKGAAGKRKAEEANLEDVNPSTGKGAAGKKKKVSKLEDAKPSNGKGVRGKRKTVSKLEDTKPSKGKGAVGKKNTLARPSKGKAAAGKKKTVPNLEDEKPSKGKVGTGKKKSISNLEDAKPSKSNGATRNRKTISKLDEAKPSNGKEAAGKRKTVSKQDDTKPSNRKGMAGKKKAVQKLEDARPSKGNVARGKGKAQTEAASEDAKPSRGKGATGKRNSVSKSEDAEPFKVKGAGRKRKIETVDNTQAKKAKKGLVG